MKKLFILTVVGLFLAISAIDAHIINFIPLPQEVIYNEGSFLMKTGLTINPASADKFNVEYLKKHLDRVFDFSVEIKNVSDAQIIFVKDASLKNEEYRLLVDDKGITITSKDKAGEFYAIQTLFQMMPAGIYKDVTGPDRMLCKEYNLQKIVISDYPRFEYRGNMLDVSRTFFDKEYIIRHLEWLAYHKINKFHIHLADDNGWRVEIKKYTLLTEKGAWRGYGEVLPPSFNSGKARYGGFYTQEDIKEIVAFASDRNIEVIPEIDLPGHSKSVTASYPQVLCESVGNYESVQGEDKNVFCVGNEDNYKMLDNIMKEIAKLFPSEYIHIGGDEVVMKSWMECPKCQALMKKEGMTEPKQLLGYFVRRMEKILQKYGKKLAGWDEITDDGELQPTSRVYAWRRMHTGLKAVQQGRPTIMQIAEYCYIDMKQSPVERGHNWAAIVTAEKMYSFDPIGSFDLTEEQKKLIVGPQAGLWAEMLILPPHFAEYQLYPRLCILAEIGWTNQELRNYQDFDNRLTLSHYERLYNMGIAFRLPYPEVKMEGNVVNVKAARPTLEVRYTFDGSEPTISSPLLINNTIITDTPEKLRFATFFATNKSMTVQVPGAIKYLTPALKVTTSMEHNKRATAERLEDNDFSTYFRSAQAPVSGDWMLFNLDEAIECKKITVQTNIPVTDFWGITDGHVEYSYNGVDFINAGEFDINNRVIITNIAAPVKAVKILVDGPGEMKAIAVQDLRIE